jgi:TolB-like protein
MGTGCDASRGDPLHYLFEDYALDTDRRELRRRGELVDLEPQVFDLLSYLVRHRDRVVSKDDLFAAVWNGRIVSESALTTRLNAARTALGDSGDAQRLIRTLRGRGIRFVGAVKEPQSTSTIDRNEPPLVFPDRPSVAVLPFANLSGDAEQDYLIDGLVEDIISALSRVRWLFVIARQSSFVYKDGPVDLHQIGRELGVRYVVQGSVRKAGDRVRIVAQLIAAETGAHLWADRFDGTLEDVFEFQDKVASSIAGVIEPTLQTVESRRSIRRPTNDLTAYDLYMRARADAVSWEKERVLRALILLKEALKCDEHYGLALGEAAVGHTVLEINGWAQDHQQNRAESINLARRALRAADNNAEVFGDVGYVLGYFEPDIHPAIALIERALELNPSYAIGWTRSGWLRLWAGQYDLGIEHFEKSLRLNPLRRAPASFGIAVAHFFARRLDIAATKLPLSLQENPGWAPCHRFLASCYAHLGRLEDAQSTIEKLRQITPLSLENATHWRIRADREYYLKGLRMAVRQKDKHARTPLDSTKRTRLG